MGECAVCGRLLSSGADQCDGCGAPSEPPRCVWHPDKRASEVCLLCERPVCVRCRSGRAPLCPDHAGARVYPDDWVEVYSSAEEIRTHLLADALRGEGIDARVLSQKDHVYVVAVGNLSVLRIVVPARAYARARATLAGDLVAEVRPPPSCPVCWTPYVEGRRECAACGILLTRRSS